jgi:Beige/BEACH domain.
MNIFYYLTYENKIDLSKINDPSMKKAFETQIVQFGKTPSQLFLKPHVQRKPLNKILRGPSIVSKEAQIKIYLPAHRKTFVKPVNFSNFWEVPERGIIKAKIFKDKEIVAVRNNGNIVKFS